ncbi:hypothetical protein QAD02_022806 [Eretmocerus hayati]|uniref:Uncharacterized protein n=1 Tax=Eretmocerus hayati TaxID=131215 RepID=A0ACC2PXE6_9HYME|nr:hypothetical protein QAD02_022806 [Eretmocerus hayati]
MAVFLSARAKIASRFLEQTISISSLTSKRTIMSSPGRLEKVLENLQKNPYFDKYAQKIAKLQQTSPEEFLQRVEEKERQAQEQKERRAKEKHFQATNEAKPDLGCVSPTKEVRLDSIMKMDLIENKSKEEITEIWQEYHKKKDCIVGVLTKEQYEKMFERGKKFNTFLLPLPRENGYEFIVSQFLGKEIHMTPLLWYQTHKENAPECLTMVHFTDLVDTKGIVLMRGEFDSKSINVTEAQCLANELQMYYAGDHPQRLKLLETFTQKPDEFKHMDLIAHLETISFDPGASGTSLDKKSNKS